MKRLVAFITGVLLVNLFLFSAAAAEFSAYSEGTRYNRIFTLDFYIQDGTSSFCSVLFSVKYNSDVVEFRGTEKTVSGSRVETYDKNGVVNVIFLVTEPIDSAEASKLLGLKFISKNGGSGSFDVTVKEAIDSNGQPLEFNESFSCPFTVTEKSSGELSVGSIKSSNFSISTNSNYNSQASQDAYTEESYESNKTSVELKALSAENREIIIAAAVLVVFFTVYIIAHYLKGRKNTSEKKNSEDSSGKDSKSS